MKLTLPLLLDGATGTELIKRGMPAGACSEMWILEHQDVLIDIQEKYVAAGSMALMAPTFGANRASLKKHGVKQSVAEINERLVAISKKASGGRALIAGDMAPTGLQPEPYGDASLELLADIFREQAQALEAAGVDYFAVETQMSTAEARAAVYAIRSVSAKPISVSFALGETGKTLYGSDILAAMAVFTSMGADIFGINCCGDVNVVCRELSRMYPYSPVPLLAKPNAGLPSEKDGAVVYPITAGEMGSWTPKLLASGASVVGACCGSDWTHIRAMKEALTEAKPVPADPPALCATDRKAFAVSDIRSPADVNCSWDLLDDALEAVESGADSVAIDIASNDALDAFAEASSSIPVPVFLHSRDAFLLENALRVYNGRALYGGGLSSAEAGRLAFRYGMIIRE